MTGYEDIVTGENGILAEVNMEDIPAGTYYLTETEALDGYELLDSDLCFTIGKNGKIVINSEGHSAWLSSGTSPRISSGRYSGSREGRRPGSGATQSPGTRPGRFPAGCPPRPRDC